MCVDNYLVWGLHELITKFNIVNNTICLYGCIHSVEAYNIAKTIHVKFYHHPDAPLEKDPGFITFKV